MTGGETELHYDFIMLQRVLSLGVKFMHVVGFGIELK